MIVLADPGTPKVGRRIRAWEAGRHDRLALREPDPAAYLERIGSADLIVRRWYVLGHRFTARQIERGAATVQLRLFA